MQVKLSSKIRIFGGFPMKAGEFRTVNIHDDATLCIAVVASLSHGYSDEVNLSGEDKAARFELALKVFNKVKLELTAEEVALIKKLIAKAFSPLVVGQCFRLLEGKDSGIASAKQKLQPPEDK